MIESNGKFETKDLYLASYLNMKGFKPGARVEESRVVFWFLDSPELRETEQAYWDRGDKVIPRDWLDKIRMMRSFADGLLKEISDERRSDKALRQPA